MGGKYSEIRKEVQANAEKAGREIKMMLDAAQAGDWIKFGTVTISASDVQYLNADQKAMITQTRKLLEQAKTENKIKDDLADDVEKVLSPFEEALKNLE